MNEIGKKIKQLRQQKNMALKELASKSNLTPSFLSQLENGMTSPSLDSLSRIAAVLDTGIAYFFHNEESKEFVFIKRRQKTGISAEDPIKNYEILASNVLDIQMLPMLMHLKKHEQLGADSCPQGAELLGVCLAGSVTIMVNNKTFTLEALDSIYLVQPGFQGMRNPGGDDARVVWVALRPRKP
jgi:transcriptional regulator with XRE-family HTH domain